ncbi:MAG: hypothetical protein M3143_04690 [Actinomycetota bacterium]|nr:hypothetical protein [Actinomycetota bacterium]
MTASVDGIETVLLPPASPRASTGDEAFLSSRLGEDTTSILLASTDTTALVDRSARAGREQ